MTSILNNAGAMVALSTLQQTNKAMLETQTMISTGKRVDNSAQDAAVWAVSTVMEADTDGFEAISDALALGKATVTVARNASEKVTDLLREMKEKIVSAQGENVDRAKIQTDIDQLKNQIGSIVSSAQFNGLNLIDGSKPSGFTVISSLDRTSSGVESASIKIDSQNLSTGNATAGNGAEITINAVDSETNIAHVFANTSANLAVTWAAANSTSDAEYELFVGGASVGSTVTIASGSSGEEIASAVFGYINGLGRDDIDVATTGARDVTISSDVKFDNLTVELKEVTAPTGVAATNADTETTLAPGVSSVVTKSNDTTPGAIANASFDVVIANANAASNIDVSINGIALAQFNVASATAADEAELFALHLNQQINVVANGDLAGKITAVHNGSTIGLINNTGEDFELEMSVTAAGTNLTIQGSDETATGTGAAQQLIGAANSDASVTATLEGKGADIAIGAAAAPNEGDSYTVFLREGTDGAVGEFTYVANAGDDQNDVARGLEALIAADDRFDVYVKAQVDEVTVANTVLRLDAEGSEDLFVAVEAREDGTAGGGLGQLAGINVTTASGAAAALTAIEDLIQTSVDAAASFGSSEKRLDIQSEFVDSLIDSFKSGVSALVDTNMEEASARLQALQVQQQLGTQALSIANSAPQSVLALFR